MSAPAVMAAISELEEKYGVDLAATVMKVTAGIIKPEVVDIFLMENENFEENKAKLLAQELKEKVFSAVADYSKIKREQAVKEKNIEKVFSPSLKFLNGDRVAGFSFSRDDEKEVGEIVKKIGDFSQSGAIADGIEKKIDEIFDKARINFGGEILAERFRSILRTHLRGIRDKIETKQTLMKAISAGGLGFDEESARNILSIAGGGVAGLIEKPITFNRPKKIFVPEDIIKKEAETIQDKNYNLNKLKNSGVRDIEYDFSSLKKENGVMEKLDTGHEIAPPHPVKKENIIDDKLAQIKTEAPTIPAEEKEEKVLKKPLLKFFQKEKETRSEFTSEKPVQSEIKIINYAIESSGRQGKIKMEDIKYKPKIMGPIDELRHMDLINFRRLGPDPFQSAENVKNKIGLFNEYSKRQEGIMAWRQSPLNKLYLEMGGASISQRQPIDVIIEERKVAGKDYLTPPEFEAIIKLNKELRF